jgi:exonuclease SbcD
MGKFLVLGDVHLGKGINIGKNIPGTYYNSRTLDQIQLLEWTLTKALEYSVSNIIITGDIFEDPKPSFLLLDLFQNWLIKCKNSGIIVNLIYGNHDILRIDKNYVSPLQLYSVIDNIKIHQDIDFINTDKLTITLLPFRDRKSLGADNLDQAINILKEQVKPSGIRNILIGHMAIRGSVYIGDEIKDITNEIILPVDFFDGFDYAIMGHIHKPQKITKRVFHIGSMDISNFGETSDVKKIIIIDDDVDDLLEINIPTRKLNQLTISIDDNDNCTETIINKLSELKDKEQLKDSIVNLKISISENNKSNVDRKVIEQFLIDNEIHHLAQISETKEKNIVRNKIAAIDNKMTVPSAINTYAEKFKDENIKNDFISTAISYYEKINKLL